MLDCRQSWLAQVMNTSQSYSHLPVFASFLWTGVWPLWDHSYGWQGRGCSPEAEEEEEIWNVRFSPKCFHQVIQQNRSLEKEGKKKRKKKKVWGKLMDGGQIFTSVVWGHSEPMTCCDHWKAASKRKSFLWFLSLCSESTTCRSIWRCKD